MYYRLAVVCLLCPWLMPAQEQTLDQLFVRAQDQLLAGDYLLARDGFAKVWQEFARTRGENDELTIEARIFYGQVLSMTGDAAKAMTVLGPVAQGESRNAMIARGSFALALRQSGELEKATRILKEVVRSFPAVPPANMVHLGRMYSELAVCLAYSGKYREAEENAREALRLIDTAEHPVPAHRASVNTILGQIYLLAHRDALAYNTLMRALEDAKPYWRSSHPELGILQGALGLLAFKAGRYDEAETRTRASIDAVERLLGPDHPEVGVLTRQLALVLKKQKRKEESRQVEARARGILERARGGPASVSAWGWREVK
jgi:tetratricopeptide (TPR) repeat protein